MNARDGLERIGELDQVVVLQDDRRAPSINSSPSFARLEDDRGILAIQDQLAAIRKPTE